MQRFMSYEEFIYRVKDGISDDRGNSPIIPVLKLFQTRWRLDVIYYLFTSDSARFNEIKFNLNGITSTMLSATLKDLCDLGLVDKKKFNETPPHVEYSLTEKGLDLLPVYYEIMNWGVAYPQKTTKKGKK